MAKATLAVIIGNRDFFPDHLVTEARADVMALFQEMDIEAVILAAEETKLGAVETWSHAKRCSELFRENRDRIDGVLVTLPNFGDEKGIADTMKLAGLDVPILVQAYPDSLDEFTVERRRDGFCGKVSVCNDLRQYGFAYTLTTLHTVHPTHPTFKTDLDRFVRVCKVVNGMRTARLGAVGARPGAFNTMRFSEKLLQASGISVTTVDLSEIFGLAWKLADDNPRVKRKVQEIKDYANATRVPDQALLRMAKLGLVISDWMQANDINATALQCWTTLQENYGVNACTLMSMMSEKLMPSACEMDITGVTGMYALQLASETPSALVDWNNNYGDDPDKCVFFHCGNWARSFLPDISIATAEILGTILGEQRTYGAVAGRVPPGPVSFARVSTDDTRGVIRTYVGEGQLTDDPLDTFGARAVVHIPGLQQLMRFICTNGFEHHVAINLSHVGNALAEAFENYLSWDVYYHTA